ncbi:MAG: hypothetical protein C5B47_02455 [Verrucomicrobia bacterium]|nr:MAG: hypothetical protein C5B47_02455 [Verrucomicrobiota bacterium]
MISKKRKILIVEAHSDDSLLSIAGYLEKNRDSFEYHFLLLTCSNLQMRQCGFVKRTDRLAEYRNYVHYFSGTWHQGKNRDLPMDCDTELDTIPKKRVVTQIEDIIDQIKPDQLIFQGASFHHDHTIVHDAVIAATRPNSLFCPLEMYIMENPSYIHSLGPHTDFKPDVYVHLTESEIQKKLECFTNCFPSQSRRLDNCLSLEGIKNWARYRGIESGCHYAEALKTYRRII